jgi:hypothetical protein
MILSSDVTHLNKENSTQLSMYTLSLMPLISEVTKIELHQKFMTFSLLIFVLSSLNAHSSNQCAPLVSNNSKVKLQNVKQVLWHIIAHNSKTINAYFILKSTHDNV